MCHFTSHRPESREAIDLLHAQGIRVALITGDAQQVAESVARELSIDEVFAEVLPGDKDQMVAELQARSDTVAMVGDGVNDAPAIARADVGIAIGAGTDVTIASAGMVLSSDDPRGVVSIHRLSKAGYRKMTQNFAWAAGYNLIAIPLAAGVLSPVGFVLPVSVGALLMSLSTVIVALNAQLLRRVDLQRIGEEPREFELVPPVLPESVMAAPESGSRGEPPAPAAMDHTRHQKQGH